MDRAGRCALDRRSRAGGWRHENLRRRHGSEKHGRHEESYRRRRKGNSKQPGAARRGPAAQRVLFPNAAGQGGPQPEILTPREFDVVALLGAIPGAIINDGKVMVLHPKDTTNPMTKKRLQQIQALRGSGALNLMSTGG